jgi:hypothetical protein
MTHIPEVPDLVMTQYTRQERHYWNFYVCDVQVVNVKDFVNDCDIFHGTKFETNFFLK